MLSERHQVEICQEKKEKISKKMTKDSPVEYSFKNKGTAKTQGPSSSVNSVGTEFH